MDRAAFEAPPLSVTRLTDDPTGSDAAISLTYRVATVQRIKPASEQARGGAAPSYSTVHDDGANRRGRPTSPAASSAPPSSGPPRPLPRRVVRPPLVQVVRLGPYPPHPHRVCPPRRSIYRIQKRAAATTSTASATAIATTTASGLGCGGP